MKLNISLVWNCEYTCFVMLCSGYLCSIVISLFFVCKLEYLLHLLRVSEWNNKSWPQKVLHSHELFFFGYIIHMDYNHTKKITFYLIYIIHWTNVIKGIQRILATDYLSRKKKGKISFTLNIVKESKTL